MTPYCRRHFAGFVCGWRAPPTYEGASHRRRREVLGSYKLALVLHELDDGIITNKYRERFRRWRMHRVSLAPFDHPPPVGTPGRAIASARRAGFGLLGSWETV